MHVISYYRFLGVNTEKRYFFLVHQANVSNVLAKSISAGSLEHCFVMNRFTSFMTSSDDPTAAICSVAAGYCM